jgi:hypothetical protein
VSPLPSGMKAVGVFGKTASRRAAAVATALDIMGEAASRHDEGRLRLIVVDVSVQ